MSDEYVVESADVGALALLSKAEIDQQITTALAHPRSIKRFNDDLFELVSLNQAVAEACTYTLMRTDGRSGKKKAIIGPSVRFAELVANTWGNCREGARPVAEEREVVRAQGVFHDLERNNYVSIEVQRRIVGRGGARFGRDMIDVTVNAACSLALRNAILRGVPRALWQIHFDQALEVIKGERSTFTERRQAALEFLTQLGAEESAIYRMLDVKGEEDIGLDELVVMRSIARAVQNKEQTIEQIFADLDPQPEARVSAAVPQAVHEAAAKKQAPKKEEAPAEPAPEPAPEPQAEVPEEEAEEAPEEIFIKRARSTRDRDVLDLVEADARDTLPKGSKPLNAVLDALADARRKIEEAETNEAAAE